MRWRGSAQEMGLALLILALLILAGVVLFQIASWEVERAPVEAVPMSIRSLVPTPTAEATNEFCKLTYPGLILPGPPPPGTVLIRLEIPKIGFVSSVFPVGLEEKGGEVVLGEPAMDTVWGLDLSDPLVQAYGWGGRNYVVWAHRADWASRWPELGIGDKILFFTVNHSEERGFYGVSYEAQVVSWRIIPVEVETDFYQASETPMITLITCHPEGDLDPQFRLVIRARFSPALTD